MYLYRINLSKAGCHWRLFTAVFFWEDIKFDKKYVKGLNYGSLIKPWIKLPILQWYDENIWHIIAKKSLIKNLKIGNLYLNTLIKELYKFIYSLKKYINKHKVPYNMEIFDNKKIRN